jgi:hypothetical protein
MLNRYILSPILFLLVICFSSSIYSQSANPEALFVIPGAYSSTVGTATFTGPTGTAQRTYQMLINANQLTALVGTHITALTFRNLTSATTAWPTSDITITNYDIFLAPGVSPSERRLTFDSNIVGTKTQVRAGSLLIPANSFAVGTAPHPFSNPPINFNTSYLYTGGHLTIEIRHTGFTGTSRANDAIGTSTSGYATDFSALWTGNYAGTAGVQGNFCIAQLTNSPIPTGITTPTGTPAEFKLSQNYPNPFNPATKIEYAIPFDSKVVLSVYDMLGKEVATLVNNNFQKAGFYSVDFNGSNLISGIYFYKITAQGSKNDFVMTKKMILIK